MLWITSTYIRATKLKLCCAANHAHTQCQEQTAYMAARLSQASQHQAQVLICTATASIGIMPHSMIGTREWMTPLHRSSCDIQHHNTNTEGTCQGPPGGSAGAPSKPSKQLCQLCCHGHSHQQQCCWAVAWPGSRGTNFFCDLTKHQHTRHQILWQTTPHLLQKPCQACRDQAVLLQSLRDMLLDAFVHSLQGPLPWGMGHNS